MRSSSVIYKMVKALGTGYYEWRVNQGEITYDLDRLKNITVSYSLANESGIGIGNANSAECRLTLREDSVNWPRMADFTVQFRISTSDGATKSGWITLGKFYTDERAEDKYGNLSIIAYDAMLTMEQSWTDKIPDGDLPASWPITAKAWATMIQGAELAAFADLTQLDDTLEFIGLDTTTTIRDVLKTIAGAHGKNWVMTPSETLKLIKFENVTAEQTSKYSNLNKDVQAFEDSPALDAVTGVHLETSEGTVMESGDDDGYVVKAICDVSDTTGIASLCLSNLEDYVYKPFQAGVAYLDPVVEIGDSVSIDGVIYQVMSLSWDIEKTPTASISAPYDQEIDHEYKVVSQEAKNYRKTMSAIDNKLEDYVGWDEVSTAIEQNAESVVIAASGTYVTQTTFNNEIAEIQAQIDGNIQSWSGNVVPTLNNAPAVNWTTSADKASHVGDMYFVNSDAGIPEAGNYYRFEENNGVYSWQLITDSAITEALARAAAAMAAAEDAQDTADAAEAEAQLKGRIFVVQPTPPYSVGDLWFNGTDSEILTCMTARASGSYVSTDWVKRNKYTDDSAFEAFQTLYEATITAIQTQIDQKAETYYQEDDPSSGWVHPVGVAIVGIDVVGIPEDIGSGHEGDLWYRTTDGTTWFWNGTIWVREDVPDDVFDKIDGKAQIFINTPYTPYNVGDLWFDSANSDIMTCVNARASGNFAQGDWQKRNKYTDDSALTTFVNATYTPQIAAIQADLDGKIDTYFYNYEPTLSNIPASQWNTDSKKDEHVDDLFYNTSNGYTYRFNKSGSTFSWVRVKDSDITAAMSAASTAQDTADGKRRVFVSQPSDAQEYDVGDLWVNATYGTTYSNDILKCKTQKDAGVSFSISHWEKASKYTDDSAFSSFVNTVYTPEIAAIQADLDGKVDTYFYAYAPTLQNAPANEWTTDTVRDEHLDDLFFNTVAGYTYRFTKSGSSYIWERIKDDDIDSAMAAASLAQDTADGKRRVFVAQPTNAQAYDVGDLWVNATYGSTYANDILKCKTAKSAGSAFNISHWEKASKYTDDSALTTFVNSTYTTEIAAIQADLDGKVDTWFCAYAPTLSNAPASDWTTTALKDDHVDDLFYDTVSGYAYRFTKSGSTYSWTRIKDSDITAAMSAASTAQDTADGKRRVFVSQPTTSDEYDIGDLWVNATYSTTYSNDLLRCKTHKDAGASFNIAHWELATKYTDDTAANAVSQELVQFVSEFSVEPSQISAEINKHVVKDHESTKTTFGWVMDDTAHTWYANNQQVAKIQQSGLSVTGSITATSGYIGNGAYGFEINATNIHNGMTSLSDTTHDGVYVGVDGIALGKGKFKATSAGVVTASDLTINGGSIKIGGTSQSPNFYVDSNGNLYANSGTFAGNVYASNIQYGGAAGTVSGAAVTPGTIYGGDQYGQIAYGTLGDYNIAQYSSGSGTYGAITPASLSEGIQASLTEADLFGYATTAGTSTYPALFKAGYITAANTMTAQDFTVSTSGGSEVNLSNHYHSIIVNDDGTVTFGRPYNSNTPPSFNVADTHAYRDAVSAVTVTSLDLEYEYDRSMHIYKMWGIAKNASEATVYRTPVNMPWNTDRSAYIDGKEDGADEVTVNTVTQYSYSSSGDKSVSIENEYLRYSNGQLIGRVNISLNGNSNTSTCVVSMDGQRVVDAARPRSIVRRTNLATGTEMPDTWNNDTNKGYAYLRATTNDSGIYYDGNLEFTPDSAIYQAGYTAGQSSGEVTITSTSAQSGWDSSTHKKTVTVDSVAKNSGGTILATDTKTVEVDATSQYNSGVNAGAQTAYPLTAIGGTASTPTWDSTDGVWYSNVPITATASGTKADGTQYQSASRQINTSVNVTSVYNAGVSAGAVTYELSTKSAVIPTNAQNYISYTSGYSFGLSGNTYTENGTTYGRIELKNDAGVTLKTIRVVVPASGNVDSITVSRISGTSQDWEFDDDHVYVGVNLTAYNGTTIVGQDTGSVNVDDVVNFWAANSYDHALVLNTTGSGDDRYTLYDTGFNWGTKLYNPSLDTGGSSVYGRVGIYNGENILLSRLRFAMSMSITAASTSYDPSDYYQSGGHWYLKIHVKNSTTEIYQGGVDVQQAVDYGGSLDWSIYQHYDMGEADGWDCRVTTGSGQTHTFWSPQRIYA